MLDLPFPRCVTTRIRGEGPNPNFFENRRSNRLSVNASVFSLRSVETIRAWPATPSRVMIALWRLSDFTSTSRVGTDTMSFASTGAAAACAGAAKADAASAARANERMEGTPRISERRDCALAAATQYQAARAGR